MIADFCQFLGLGFRALHCALLSFAILVVAFVFLRFYLGSSGFLYILHLHGNSTTGRARGEWGAGFRVGGSGLKVQVVSSAFRL